MAYKDPQKQKQKQKEYSARRRQRLQAEGLCISCGKHPHSETNKSLCETCRQYHLDQYQRDIEYRRARVRDRYWVDPEKGRAYVVERSRKFRREGLTAYGGSCSCCGEDRWEFLTLHHVDGDGAGHRESLDLKKGSDFYYKMKMQGYPTGLEVLCFNCHYSHHFYGSCPHVERVPIPDKLPSMSLTPRVKSLRPDKRNPA